MGIDITVAAGKFTRNADDSGNTGVAFLSQFYIPLQSPLAHVNRRSVLARQTLPTFVGAE
jgi:hypothetical protein